ncbi:Tetracycline resistance protein, class B [Symmachiella macrocystis]|uniref:Tetracycline resistance protein, class B n=1 Tax=Symmachiella macrocystis TaxID=2527985 RepID=A0A5C6BE44_9PLAN|nr:MFS transporter [Symmachiella macrocystis]TWU09549.1 Tetracycline resistance protein, class B [Symmachiella macrocystis]
MSKHSKASLGVIFVTVFIDLLGFGIVLPLLPRYGKFFEADHLLGPLMASFSAMQFLFAPAWGRLSDRIGRRPVLIVGLAGSTISYFMFGYATSLGKDDTLLGLGVLAWLFISRIGAGIAGATIPTAQAYIADVTGPEQRARGMALIGAAFGIGFTFGPLIGAGFVSDQVNAPPSAAPGYVAAVMSGLALLSAIFWLKESLEPGNTPIRHHWFDRSSLRNALSQPKISMILLTIFITTFAFAQFESTLSLLTRNLGMSPRSNFWIFAYVGLVLTIAQGVLVRRLLPRMGEYRMSVAGAILMTVGLLLVGLAGQQGSTGMLFAVLPVSVVGFSALTPSLQSLLSRGTSASQQGGILGLGQSLSALARIFGPWLGISLFLDDMFIPYAVAAGIMAVGFVMVLGLRNFSHSIDIAEK